MLKEQVLKEFFTINDKPEEWTSLETLNGAPPPGFRKNRIAKSTDEQIFFPIGETEKGKAAGLSETIKTIIREAGLQLHEKSSSNGTKIYAGFNLNDVSDDELREILRQIDAAIASVA